MILVIIWASILGSGNRGPVSMLGVATLGPYTHVCRCDPSEMILVIIWASILGSGNRGPVSMLGVATLGPYTHVCRCYTSHP